MLTVHRSMPCDLYRILGNATMGCDNITYLHLGFPKYEIPHLFLLRDLHLPALMDLSFIAFMHFNLDVVYILECVSIFSNFCAAHELSSARFEISHAWRCYSPEARTFLIDVINEVHIESHSSRVPLRHPAFGTQMGQAALSSGDGSERFYHGTVSTRQPNTCAKEVLANTAPSDRHEHPIKDISIANAESNKIHDLTRRKIRYVAREIRLAVGAYFKGRIYNLADILFGMDPSKVAPEKKSKRWGTELSRICLDKVFIDQTIWNLDHVDSLSNLRILAVNQICHSKASCIGHVDTCWSLSYDSHLCKEYSPRRDGDSAANACPAKRRVLKSMAEALVQQCAKQLPSLQMVYLDSERFWVEREDGEDRKVWRLWDAMDHPLQRKKIDCDISLEDWAFLSCQDADDMVIFRREEVAG